MTPSVIELLEEIRHLMRLKGENPFKIRAYEKAARVLAGREDLLDRARAGTLAELPGVGKGISDTLTEFLLRGRCSIRDELESSLPAGLLELTRVPGLGPAKARQLVSELGISSIGELEYACRENRLLKLRGFGEKVQHKLIESIAFLRANRGRLRLDEAFSQAEALGAALVRAAGGWRVSETGALRRRMETLSELEFLVELPADRSALDAAVERFGSTRAGALPVRIFQAEASRFGYELARTTGSDAHWRSLGSPDPFEARTEEEFFSKLNLSWIPPEMRETGEEIALARAGTLAEVLPWNGVRGVFHNHTVRSDGSATIEQMVLAARDLGFSYIGISDHSQSAFYAHGLKPEDLPGQEREIREVQERHPEIRVFWGIESDILADGSLDYEPGVLGRFDFVIASVHSRFQMDRETMTRRVIEAIRNPRTRFLGHATGRLLLGRQGYELDMERVIEEAALHEVAIEINANPARLDIDWRWGPELRRRGVPVSINPDAHETAGLSDTRFGVAMARKALLPAALVLNSRPAAEVERWLKRAG